MTTELTNEQIEKIWPKAFGGVGFARAIIREALAQQSARHAEELAAYELTASNLRAELARLQAACDKFSEDDVLAGGAPILPDWYQCPDTDRWYESSEDADLIESVFQSGPAVGDEFELDVCWNGKQKFRITAVGGDDSDDIDMELIESSRELYAAAPQPPAKKYPEPGTTWFQRNTPQEYIDEVMSQAQVMASAWSLVGSRFDNGGAMQAFEDAKQELREMLAATQAPETVPHDNCVPVAVLVETDSGVMVWPIRGSAEACTYCDPDEIPQMLYLHPAAPQAQPEPPLTCDFCGCETPDPWHGSTETNHHIHACDACRPMLPAAQAPEPERKPMHEGGIDEDTRQKAYEAVADALGDAYDCMRVWSAWGVGTMTEDDFSLVSEDCGRVAEIADAAIDAMLSAAQAPQDQPAQSNDEVIMRAYHSTPRLPERYDSPEKYMLVFGRNLLELTQGQPERKPMPEHIARHLAIMALPYSVRDYAINLVRSVEAFHGIGADK